MKQQRSITRILFFFFVFFSSLVIFFERTIAIDSMISILTVVSALVAAIAALSVSYRYGGIRTPHGKSIMVCAVGLLLWSLGELTWELFDHVLHIDPFPSLADVFYLTAYPMLSIGLLMEMRIARIEWNHIPRRQVVIGGSIILLFTFLVGYFGIYQAYDPDISVLENVVAIGYGVGDLILIYLSLFVLKTAVEYFGGALFGAWVSILVGFVLTLVADIVFAMFEPQYSSNIAPFTYIDSLWFGAYLMFMYGFLQIDTILVRLAARAKALVQQKNTYT